jgi:hypothetical protein
LNFGKRSIVFHKKGEVKSKTPTRQIKDLTQRSLSKIQDD